MEAPFQITVSRMIWESRYRYRRADSAAEAGIEDSWRRVAGALASVESRQRDVWERRFYDLLQDFRFLPGGRILAGAGTGYNVTLLNCFVMGPIQDSMEGIFDALKEGALTMQRGGGVGYDFSTLRPAGSVAWRVGGVASGPVSYMKIWDGMCKTLLSTARRRGAMMATLRCDHPDVEAFIDAKRTPGELTNFNLSVLVSDSFMQAVADDGNWPLLFPVAGLGGAGHCGGRPVLNRDWPGYAEPVPCAVLREVRARDLWARILRANYDCAEPGVLFIDRINRENNLGYRERISATNPCGEIPLPPYGACDLGSLNLTRFVRDPFDSEARLDLPAIATAAAVAVRMLDNVIDLSQFPLEQQREQARGNRRIGLGITGLADALIMLGLHYGSRAAREVAADCLATICHSAYRSSVALAAEKGSYPLLEREECLERPFIRALPEDIRQGIARDGLRNSHLIALAPTGTISLLANNVSSGIEPVFAFEYRRRIRCPDDVFRWFELQDNALRQWRARFEVRDLPEYFVAATDLSPMAHLQMQAALQPLVDNAISKTINVPAQLDFAEFCEIYDHAYRLGLKGCTTYRPQPETGAVLLADGDASPQPDSRCCELEREQN